MQLRYLLLTFSVLIMAITASAQSKLSLGPSFSVGKGFSQTRTEIAGTGDFNQITSIYTSMGLAGQYKLTEQLSIQSGIELGKQRLQYGFSRVITPDYTYINVITGFSAKSVKVPLTLNYLILKQEQTNLSLSGMAGFSFDYYYSRTGYSGNFKSIAIGGDSSYQELNYSAQSRPLLNPGLIVGLSLGKVLSNGHRVEFSAGYRQNFRKIFTGSAEIIQIQGTPSGPEESIERYAFNSRGSRFQMHLYYYFPIGAN